MSLHPSKYAPTRKNGALILLLALMLSPVIAGTQTALTHEIPWSSGMDVQISANGSGNFTVSPSSAPVTVSGNSATGGTATLLSDLDGSIVKLYYVSNLVFDGSGHTISDKAFGVSVYGVNVTVQNVKIALNGASQSRGVFFQSPSLGGRVFNCEISNCVEGIAFEAGAGSVVGTGLASGNKISNCGDGIYISSISSAEVRGNTITNCSKGVEIYGNHGLVYGNTISSCRLGVSLIGSTGNKIYNNHFLNNTKHAWVDRKTPNTWDLGYPSGGNYWDSYTGADQFSGAKQDKAGKDGIGDTPYVIDDANRDNYPRMSVLEGIIIDEDGLVDPPDSPIIHSMGIYLFKANVSKPVHILRSNCIVDGGGYRISDVGETDGVVKKAGVSIKASNVTLRNIRVESCSLGVVIAGDDVSVENVTVRECGGAGVVIQSGGSENSVLNCTLARNGGEGITVTGSKNTTIENNYFDNNKFLGIKVSGSEGSLIKGNEMVFNDPYNIMIEKSTLSTVTNNSILKGTHGILLLKSDSNTVSTNTVEGCILCGITIEGSNKNNILANKMINNPISCAFSNVTVISGNTISCQVKEYDGVLREGKVNGIEVTYSKNNIIIGNILDRLSVCVMIVNSDHIKVMNNIIKESNMGVGLEYSNVNVILGNVITNCLPYAIDIGYSNDNEVYSNQLLYKNVTDTYSDMDQTAGVKCFQSLRNDVYNNTVSRYSYGFIVTEASNNKLYHNKILNTRKGNVGIDISSSNSWDNGYPSGGNYWGSIQTIDLHSGPKQDQPNSDGLGDNSYVINQDNYDRYPLTEVWNKPIIAETKIGDNIHVISIVTKCSVVQVFALTDSLQFTVTGIAGEKGYAHITCPRANTTALNVYMDGIPYDSTITSSEANYDIYIEFGLSTHIILIPFTIEAIPGMKNIEFTFEETGYPSTNSRELAVAFDYIQILDVDKELLTTVDMGTDSSRGFLGEGWYGNEYVWDDVENFVWTGKSGKRASVNAQVPDDAVYLAFKALSFPENQTISLRVDGEQIGGVSMSQGWHTYIVKLDRTACKLTLSASADKVEPGQKVTFSGATTPPIGSAGVNLTLTSPSGVKSMASNVTDGSGKFSIRFKPTEKGTWSALASLVDDESYFGENSTSISFSVEEAQQGSGGGVPGFPVEATALGILFLVAWMCLRTRASVKARARRGVWQRPCVSRCDIL